MNMKRKVIKLLFVLSIVLCTGNVKEANAATKAELVKKIESQTADKVSKVYYSDYDSDGVKEAFIITEKSQDQQSIWFASGTEVKKLAWAWITVGKGRGICKVSSKQKIFIAEGSAGGSSSWSYCYYVKKGRVYAVKRAGEGLIHNSGCNFTIYPGDFDSNCYNGDWSGHTWKAYYLRWTGTHFEQYTGTLISQSKVKSYSGGSGYLKQIQESGYKIGKIYYRNNGIININVSREVTNRGTDYSNVTLMTHGKKVELVVVDSKGKNIVEKSGYGGIYKKRCYIAEPINL